MFFLGYFLEQNKQKTSSRQKKLLSPSANKIHFVVVNLLCHCHPMQTIPNRGFLPKVLQAFSDTRKTYYILHEVKLTLSEIEPMQAQIEMNIRNYGLAGGDI